MILFGEEGGGEGEGEGGREGAEMTAIFFGMCYYSISSL